MSNVQIRTIAGITNEEIRELLIEVSKLNESIDKDINNLIPHFFDLAKEKN